LKYADFIKNVWKNIFFVVLLQHQNPQAYGFQSLEKEVKLKLGVVLCL